MSSRNPESRGRNSEHDAPQGLIQKQLVEDILAAHRSWIVSGHRGGQRANFRGSNLEGADLSTTNLEGADLAGANLKGADLGGADLRGANLVDANLENADLRGATLEQAVLTGAILHGANLLHATLREADLQDAELTSVRGLVCGQLAGSNLAGAKLPDAIAQFEALHHIEAAAHIARPMFIIMLLACISALATTFSTSDPALLNNSPAALLHNVTTPIPTATFFFVAPIVIFSLYMYLHIYIKYLCEDITYLPSIFPDGIPLYKKVYPWVLVRLAARLIYRVRSESAREKSSLTGIVNYLFILIAWWLVPVTLVIFWARYLPAHDWIGTGLQVALIVMASGSGGLGLGSYKLAHARLLGPESKSINKKRQLRDPAYLQSAIAAAVGVVLIGLSFGSIHGTRSDLPVLSDVRTWTPSALRLIGFSSFARLREADISTKSQDWTSTTDNYSQITGAILRGKNLRYADASRAFLVKADLREADLFGANLTEANLAEADFRGANLERTVQIFANLQDTNLSNANLKEANLRNANFQGADLASANLQGANLHQANLSKGRIGRANLQDTDLSRADLQEASMVEANLQEADLGAANLQKTNLRGASLQKALLVNANLTKAYLVGANLQGANLGGANFSTAYLAHANLKGADLTHANLREADLVGANLQGARLFRASLNGASLWGTDLRGANLQGAHLAGAAFRGAMFGPGSADPINHETDLRGADLTRAFGLTQKQLDQACGDEKTYLPKGLTIKLCPREAGSSN